MNSSNRALQAVRRLEPLRIFNKESEVTAANGGTVNDGVAGQRIRRINSDLVRSAQPGALAENNVEWEVRKREIRKCYGNNYYFSEAGFATTAM
jgi:hypothetical protein